MSANDISVGDLMMVSKRTARKDYQREHYHRPKIKEQRRKYNQIPEVKERRQARNRKRQTGISQELFDKLLEMQGGACAICLKPFVGTPHADHCHDTKRPRGVLCSACNYAEGWIKKIGITPEEFGKRLGMYLGAPPVEQLTKEER